MTPRRLAVLVALVAFLVIDFVAGHGDSEAWWHAMPGFDLLYGLAGASAIVWGAKFLGAAGLQRRSDSAERGEVRLKPDVHD